MGTLDFKEAECRKLLEQVKSKIPDSTYVSFLLFKNGKLLQSINNNYNDWPQHYTADDMRYDDVFYEISHKKINKSNQTICFWNSIPHESQQSLDIDAKRKQFNLYNGVTILKYYDDEYTIGINLASTKEADEDSFYSQVILKRKSLLDALQSSALLVSVDKNKQ